MTTGQSSTGFTAGGSALKTAGRWMRAAVAAVIAVAFIALVFFLAAALTATVLVIAGIALLAGGAYWLWLKVRGRTPDVDIKVESVRTESEGGESEAEVLVARRGPHGWTIERA